MYFVIATYYGRPVVTAGPASGCADFPQWRHVHVTARPVGYKRAVRLAQEQSTWARVYEWDRPGTAAAWDNGKPPAAPLGWLEDAGWQTDPDYKSAMDF